MRKVAALLLVVVSMSAALVRAYSVEPKTAAWSGWTDTIRPYDYVSEVITCNWDHLDSTTGGYVELFTGHHGAGGNYHLNVYEHENGPRVAYRHDVAPGREHTWLKFDHIKMELGKSFTKGKQYEFRFTRSGSDSIQYYTQPGTAYRYGFLKTGPGLDYPTLDLCMRLAATMRPVEETYFGMIPGAYPDAQQMGRWKDRLRESGARRVLFDIYWPEIQPTGPGSWDFSTFDSRLAYLACTLGCEVLGRVQLCPKWASSRITLLQGNPDHYDTTIYCAPRNLWHSTVPEDSNYWARFIDTLVRHYDSAVWGGIHSWEIWNEPNDTCTQDIPGITGWWRRPNVQYNVEGGLRGLCSLYVQLCAVAEEQIRSVPGHGADRVLVGSLHGATLSDVYLAPDVQWLAECYDLADAWGYPEAFWDGVSFHPYQHGLRDFSPVVYEQEAETLRAVMRASKDFGELWNTEIGWCTTWTREQHAANLCEAYVSGKGSEALPQGGYDWVCWYLFREPWTRFGHWGLVDSTMDSLRPAFYAYRHLLGGIAGKRLNGRVMVGDSLRRFVYEFEDPASGGLSWVGWFSPDDAVPNPPPQLALPTRSDMGDTARLAYEPDPPQGETEAAPNGWTSIQLTGRPIFLAEAGEVSRPELRVDSVACKQLFSPSRTNTTADLTVKVKNHGNRATPDITRVGFYWNGDLFTAGDIVGLIDTQSTRTVTFNNVTLPNRVYGWGLFSAGVNPGQEFVEKEGMDDNTGYLRTYLWGPARGEIDVIGGPGGRTNVPLVLLRAVPEAEGDSMRFLQLYYGTGDSLLALDSTPWFGFGGECASFDTIWRFPYGEGRYRLLGQSMDSLGDVCQPFPSMYDTIVFDSTPPAGTMEVNSGERFARGQWCEIGSAMFDSLSAVAEMRLGNRPLSNLVTNSCFADTGGWEFSPGSSDDEGLGMRLA